MTDTCLRRIWRTVFSNPTLVNDVTVPIVPMEILQVGCDLHPSLTWGIQRLDTIGPKFDLSDILPIGRPQYNTMSCPSCWHWTSHRRLTMVVMGYYLHYIISYFHISMIMQIYAFHRGVCYIIPKYAQSPTIQIKNIQNKIKKWNRKLQ